MKNRILILTALVLTGIFSCTNKHSNDAVPQRQCPSDTIQVVSFSKQVLPIFVQNCAVSGCHTASSKAGKLVLDSASAYQMLQKAGSGYIDTSDPSGSLLYNQMISVSNPMPPTGRLDTCTSKLILKWITQKALNN